MAESESITAEPCDRVRALVASFERIARDSMSGLPFYNDVLSVEAVGFERFGDGWSLTQRRPTARSARSRCPAGP